MLNMYLSNYYSVSKHIPVVVKKEEIVVNQDEVKLKEIKKLHEENNDLVRWIKIDGTKIDYPVMYTKGKDYYLRRDFYKNYFKAGSIFINKNNILEPRDINLMIYGHNMKDGFMFNDLLKYKDYDFYKLHKRITLYTIDEKEEYEIISVFLSQVYKVTDNVFKYYNFYNIESNDEYNNYIKNIKYLSLYKIDETAVYPEELITLTTCEYSKENGRMIVVAKKIID